MKRTSEAGSKLTDVWEKATTTTFEEISGRRRAYYEKFGQRIDSRLPETVVAFDQAELAEVLAVKTTPPEVQDLWHSAFQAKVPMDYDRFVETAQALNPYYRNPEFTVGNRVGLLRTIGWSFAALDKARIIATAKIICELPDKAVFTTHRGDIMGKYWYESTNWSTWTSSEFRDEQLKDESVLRGWLNPEYTFSGGTFSQIIGYDYQENNLRIPRF